VRHKWVGKIGKADLSYDKVTGRYSEPATANPKRSHRNDI
jgi:hypothetical protein